MTSCKAAFAVVLCSVLALLNGCTTSQFLSGTDTEPVAGAAVQGIVHGGQNPVIGATVQLWQVGSTGYGSPAAPLGASVPTIAGGAFTLGTYTCPTSSTQTYITSSGGNPGLGAGTNSNIMLVAALGNCGSLNSGTTIFINEVTTAAAAFALGQYFTATFGLASTDSFGAPALTNIQANTGLANAFATVNNLVCGVSTNPLCTGATGNAVTSATITGTGGTITATPESAKLYTIADILAACVNSAGGSAGDGTACGTLFADVTPSGATVPTDTLQAAVYMSLNPTSTNANTSATNLAALCGLVSGVAPYQTGAPYATTCPTTTPSDWTIGIQYTAASTSPLLSEPLDLAADASGNIWIINNPGSANNSLTELSATGSPLLTSNLASGSATLASNNPRNLAIDTTGDIWVASSSSSAYLFEYNPSTSAISTLGIGSSTYGIAIDGSNNVFVTKESSSATYSVEEFLGGNLTPISGSTVYGQYEVAFPSDESAIQPEYAAVDSSGNVWMTPGSSNTGAFALVELSNINYSSCTFPETVSVCAPSTSASQNTYTTVSAGALAEPYGLAASASGVWVANAGTGADTVSYLTGSGPSVTGNAYPTSANLNLPHYVAVDGNGNVWVANKTSSPGSVAELSGTGTLLSPAPGFSHAGITTAEGISIDPSGNVWVADDASSTYSVFEIVGAAAPTVTPVSLALKNGAVGKKP
jgi:hypothetical protein